MSETPDVVDASGNKNHGRTVNPTRVRKGLAPILGEGATCHLHAEGYIEGGTLGQFGTGLSSGFHLGMDVQPEDDKHLTLCGTGVSGKTSFAVFLNASDAGRRLQVEVRDDYGRTLMGFTQLSGWPAKRLFISVDPPKNQIRFSEVNLHEGNSELETIYIKSENPCHFSNFSHALLLGGFNLDGVRQGSYTGRLGNFYLNGNGSLSDERLEKYRRASREDITSIYGNRPKVTPSQERRAVFTDDLSKLKKWLTQPSLSDSEMRDASVILYRWLSDKHALLQDLCDELGIQLSLPGESDAARGYHEAVQKDKPAYAQPVHIGRRSILGFKWVPLNQFLNDTAFVVEGHVVTHDAFIKFVRSKLGGGHFDEVDRRKWQKTLAVLPVYLGSDRAMNFHMKQVLHSVLDSIEGCGVEPQIRTASQTTAAQLRAKPRS
jgi:hypothetical protein